MSFDFELSYDNLDCFSFTFYNVYIRGEDCFGTKSFEYENALNAENPDITVFGFKYILDSGRFRYFNRT